MKLKVKEILTQLVSPNSSVGKVMCANSSLISGPRFKSLPGHQHKNSFQRLKVNEEVKMRKKMGTQSIEKKLGQAVASKYLCLSHKGVTFH